jgi:hypothetical protein
MRTTVDIDPVILEQLKARQVAERKSLSTLVSELLAVALADRAERTTSSLSWPTGSLGARVDIDDQDAVWAVLDEKSAER